MSAKFWVHAADGNWTSTNRWSPAGAPTGSDDAVIAATGTSYTVFIRHDQAVNSLAINSADATLEVDSTGSLSVAGALDITAGTLNLNDGDVVAGSVLYQGASLDINSFFSTLEVKTSLTVTDAAGTGAGTLNLTQGTLVLDDTQTLDNLTINLGYVGYLEQQALNGSATLTLGPHVTINATNGGIDIAQGFQKATLVNQGTINLGGANTFFSIDPLHFDNQGTINANGTNGHLTLEGSVANEGVIDIANGYSFDVNSETFTNSGSIAIGGGGSLNLFAHLTVADLGTITNSGGSIFIRGTLDNTGHTLDGTDVPEVVLYQGTIHSGIVTPDGVEFSTGAFSTDGGTLDGVTYKGTLDLSAASTVLSIANGLTDLDAAGTGPGTINLTGERSQLFFNDTQTFDNATINIGSDSAFAHSYLNQSGRGTITFGPDATINQVGAFATIVAEFGSTFINHGTINAGLAGGTFEIGLGDFTNHGTINASGAGAQLTVDATTFDNEGTFNVSNGDTAVIQTSPNNNISILDASFTNFGTLSVGDDSAMDLSGGALGNFGTIELDGGTLTSASVIYNAYGALKGHGTVDAAISNIGGMIEANGGTLTLLGAVNGDGMFETSLQIDAGATLVLAGTVDNTVGVAFDGGVGSTLKIAMPASFASTISGVGLDEAIDLVGIRANGVTLNGSNELIVTHHGTVVDTLQLSGNYDNFSFIVQSDGNGGTDIVAIPKDYSVAWAQAVSGNFDDAGNWNPASVPVESSDVSIVRTGAFTVSDTTDHTINSLRIGNTEATLEVSHASLTINGDLLNKGSLTADDASIHIGGAQLASGTIAINGDSTIEFGGAARGHVTFDIGGHGTLALDQSSAFKGNITGFGNDDTLDFNDIAYSTAHGARTVLKYTDDGTGNAGTLLVKDAAGDVAKLAMVGHYTADNFVMADDGSGHVAVHVHDLLV